jgi:hypothetical protein
VRRPPAGAGAVGESGSASTHGRIQSRCISALLQSGTSSRTWRSKIAKIERASSASPRPQTAASSSCQLFARTSGGSSATSARISRSASSGATVMPERTYSAGAWTAQVVRGSSRSSSHASSR